MTVPPDLFYLLYRQIIQILKTYKNNSDSAAEVMYPAYENLDEEYTLIQRQVNNAH
jgi:hypothetical protein